MALKFNPFTGKLDFVGSGSASPINIQVFTTPGGTWTKPAGARKVQVELVGGGGGGSSGRKGAALSARVGGAGGGGGGYTKLEFNATDLTSTVAVTVGAGGAGGASQTVNNSSGNGGSQGGATIFGNYAEAKNGAGGQSNGTSAGSGGQGSFIGSSGGPSSNTGNASSGIQSAYISGGGGGSGINTTNDILNAGNGGTVGSSPILRSNSGTNTTPPNVVTHGYIAPLGFGGGGGFGSIIGNAQAGANGGLYGAGGGGGGAATNDVGNSGAGGNGAAGIAIITTYF